MLSDDILALAERLFMKSAGDYAEEDRVESDLRAIAVEIALLEANDEQLRTVNQQLAQANWALEQRMLELQEAVEHANDTALATGGTNATPGDGLPEGYGVAPDS